MAGEVVDELRGLLSDAIAEQRKWLVAGPSGWANFKPNTTGGNSLDYAGHMRTLSDMISSLQQQIKDAQSQEAWEFISEVET